MNSTCQRLGLSTFTMTVIDQKDKARKGIDGMYGNFLVPILLI